MSTFTTKHAAKYFGTTPKRLRHVMRDRCDIRIGSGNPHKFDGPEYAYLCETLQSAGLAPDAAAPADCRPPRVSAEELAAASDSYPPFANAFRRKN